jgi:dihydrofolate synthase/folylpolyglutamate synthase
VRWEARLEILRRAPWIVLDAAHTIESIACLRQALTEFFPHQRLILVLGMAADKKVANILATLAPIAHEVIVIRFSNPRAYDPQRLAVLLQSHGLPVDIALDPTTALALARQRATPADLICVTGSLLLLGELKARLQGLPLEC